MRRDLTSSALAVLVFTLLLGIAYPLATTGIAQVLFPGNAEGSRVEHDGRTVGSKLIGQDFHGDPRYFQGRPSVTGYDPRGTYFNNLGPNNRELARMFRANLRRYVALERPYNPGLRADGVPVDAVTTTASGVDPHISEANARIQERRVAAVRRLPLRAVQRLVEDHTDDRDLGVLGEPGVNVLELNLAVDAAMRAR
jgi:K+-transporting ATPase ATPase C chain